MIKANKKTYRQTVAKWLVCEDGEEHSEEIRVQYYPLSVKDLKEAQAKTGDEKLWMSDALIKRLHLLPDLVNDDETPVKITLDFLDEQSITNLKNVFDSINEHENPSEKK